MKKKTKKTSKKAEKKLDKKSDMGQNVEKLILLGKKKGFLTYDEVNESLSESVESSDEIDKVFDILDAKDIKILESEDGSDSKEILDGETREQQIRRVREENKEDDIYSDKFIPLDDPVKMYLKQMGSIPLLSRENEISLAKRIEEAEIKFAESLYMTAYARTKALKTVNRVLGEEINVEDVIKDELDRRDKLIYELQRIQRDVSRTRVGSEKSAIALAEFKMTAAFNEKILEEIKVKVAQIEKIERT
ncbi:RNA polymerase sigma factor RpoD, partial [hydrothermal vent metagenome]